MAMKYNAKEVVVQGGGQDGKGEYAGPRARQEVGRTGPSAEQGGEVSGPGWLHEQNVP